MKESQIQKEILHWLSLQPKDQMFSWRMYTGPIVRGNPAKGKTFFTPNPCPGLPDIIVIIKGRFVGLEIKQPKGRQSTEQKTGTGEGERTHGIHGRLLGNEGKAPDGGG